MNKKKQLIPFRELPEELATLICKRLFSLIFLSLIFIFVCIYLHSFRIVLCSILCIVVSIVLFIGQYFQIAGGTLQTLDAECVRINVSKFKFFSSETKVELILKKDNRFYYTNISKKQASKIVEGMMVRIYVTPQNVYRKENGQIVLLNPVYLSPVY